MEDNEYKDFIRTKPCLVCFNIGTIPHHVRTGFNAGAGKKPSDLWCVPVCIECHLHVHSKGERAFWASKNVEIGIEVARLLIEYHSEVKT